jgi:hypothetical protein
VMSKAVEKLASHPRLYLGDPLVLGPDNLTYYRKRALDERKMAATSTTRVVSSIHLRLAELYEARIAEIEVWPPLRLVSSTPESGAPATRREDSDEAAAQRG